MGESECLFCQIAQGQAPSVKVWEGDDFLAIENKYPKAPIHILVLPKAHVSKEKLAQGQNPEFWAKVMSAVFQVVRLKGMDKSGYKLANYGAGYNHFDHEHIHVMGGSATEPQG